MKKSILKYRNNENLSFNIDNPQIVTILGNSNNRILNNLTFKSKQGNIFVEDLELNEQNLFKYYRNISFVLHRHLNVFSCHTVKDEIAFPLESLAISRNEINELINKEAQKYKIENILNKDTSSLGTSDKTLVKILSALIIKPKILILQDILSELDKNDYENIQKIFKEFIKDNGVIINLTNDVEQTLISDRTIIVNDMKLISDDKTLNVLKEEKMLKDLKINLPFIVELNKYLIDYGLIDKYYIDYRKLVKAIWK